MTIKSVTIHGMHNVDEHKFVISDGCNYFCGPNGAGKSTILQAIQLALLGYIPGTGKTASAIMQHSNSNVMSVSVEMGSDTECISITRTYVRKGKSVSSIVDISPDSYTEEQISEMVGDMELPVFNFTDFLNMSANKMKDWFIQFLPKSNYTLDWMSILSRVLSKNQADLTQSSDILQDTYTWIQDLPNNTDVSAIPIVHDYLKSELSSKKYMADTYAKSISTLIFYDDVADTDLQSTLAAQKDCKDHLDALRNQKADLIKATQVAESNATISKQISEVDAEIVRISEKLSNTDTSLIGSDDITGLTERLENIQNDINNYDVQLAQMDKLLASEGICPYTDKVCDSIKLQCTKIPDIKNTVIEKRVKAQTDQRSLQDELKSIYDAQKLAESLNLQYKMLQDRKIQYENMIVNPTEIDNGIDMVTLDNEISKYEQEYTNCTTAIAKIQANTEYSKMMDDLSKSKIQCDLDIQVLKDWIKVTGENGIITDIVSQSFHELETAMTGPLQSMFNSTEVTSRFIVEAVNNSFNFGITRNGEFISYNSLSSGEKCIYMVALLFALYKLQDTPDLKLILIDDVFDHLDKTKVVSTFDAIGNLKDVQWILAGVAPCKSDLIKIVELS